MRPSIGSVVAHRRREGGRRPEAIAIKSLRYYVLDKADIVAKPNKRRAAKCFWF
jgi:hypothetical protein